MSRLVRGALVPLLLLGLVQPVVAQQTIAEKTAWQKTSTYLDVRAFLDTVVQRAPTVLRQGILGTTPEGRDLPYIVAARPMVATPAAAKQSGKPVLYIQANIHGGEVEGKEAMQMMLRDLGTGPLQPLLDSVILLIVPIYNADGNESWGLNRPGQNGPDTTGTRSNTLGLNLNRDYIKAISSETQTSLTFLTEWDPDLFMDLHTSNGSYHGYGLTYAPGLNPNPAPANRWVQDVVLPAVRQSLRARQVLETFSYGNFRSGNRPESGWVTYESTPRFGTNLMGMTRLSILTEAYSNDPFPVRVKSTYDYVLEVIRYVAARPTEGREMMARTIAFRPDSVVVRSTFAPAVMDTVVAESIGVGALVNGRYQRNTRTGVYQSLVIPVIDRFVGTRSEAMPAAYLLPAVMADSVIPWMQRHGIEIDRVTAAWRGPVAHFRLDTVISLNPFERRPMGRVEGAWQTPQADTVGAGAFLIRTDQRYGLLAAFLLEPASEDGFGAWSFYDRWLSQGQPHPVRRLMQLPADLTRTPIR